MKVSVLKSESKRFSFALSEDLTREQEQALIELVQLPVEKAQTVLGGRRTVAVGDLPGVGPVAIKHYTRGGLLGKGVSQWYLRLGSIRSKIEFDLMREARAIGVSVPEPVGYGWQGRIFYRTWLVSRAVGPHRTLADVSTKDVRSCERILPRLVGEIEKLIICGIFHIDLHPGNVLITDEDEIFLIDFDKARKFSGDRNVLRDRYLCRWRRAVLKHNLPEMLCEHLCAGLRRNFSNGTNTAREVRG